MRYFTPDEANEFVPALREAFDRIDRDRAELVQLVGEVEALGHDTDIEAETPKDDMPAPVKQRLGKARFLMRRIRGIVGELQAHGLEVKRLDGQVDFRSLRGQRPVYLSWRKGESRIEHWHEFGSDASERRPVDRLFKPAQLN